MGYRTPALLVIPSDFRNDRFAVREADQGNMRTERLITKTSRPYAVPFQFFNQPLPAQAQLFRRS